MENTTEIKSIISDLNSSDPYIRRSTIEKFLSEEMSDEIANTIAAMLEDEDTGVRDAVSNTLIVNGNSNIPEYVVPFVSSKDIASRNMAGEILLRKGSAALPSMIAYIPKGDDDDKKFVIDVMGLIGDQQPGPDILTVLKENKNENVILACIEALGNIRFEESVDEIIAKYDESELYAPTIIEALGKIGSEKGLAFMAEKYKEVDDLIRFSIIESFGLVGNEEAFFLILSELRNMNNALSWAAIESLGKMKEKLQLDVPFDESIKNAIVKTLVEADMRFKKAAAYLVSAYNDKEIIIALLNIYGEDPEVDDNIKMKCFENPVFFYPIIIQKVSGSPENIKVLLELIKEIIQSDGGESLGQLKDLDLRNLSTALTTNLEHPDEEVRRSCVELLFFLAPDTAIMFLDTMVEDDDFWNRLRVLEIIEQIPDENVNEAIIKLAGDSEEMIREKALAIMEERGLENIELKA